MAADESTAPGDGAHLLTIRRYGTLRNALACMFASALLIYVGFRPGFYVGIAAVYWLIVGFNNVGTTITVTSDAIAGKELGHRPCTIRKDDLSACWFHRLTVHGRGGVELAFLELSMGGGNTIKAPKHGWGSRAQRRKLFRAVGDWLSSQSNLTVDDGTMNFIADATR